MRVTRWAWVGVFALALASDARAQNFQTALTGVSPANIQYKQVDIKGAMAGTPALTSVGASGFSLTSFFRKMVGLGSPVVGGSVIPAPMYANGYNPRMPINSTIGK